MPLCLQQPDEDLRVYRRNLPHWGLGGSVYCVTWRLGAGRPDLVPPERGRVLSALRHFDRQRYHLLAWVVMNDHVHVLVMPLGSCQLQDIVHGWKSYTAIRIQRARGIAGPLWQEEYFDRIVRDDREFLYTAEYILNNPRERWPEIEDYASGAGRGRSIEHGQDARATTTGTITTPRC